MNPELVTHKLEKKLHKTEMVGISGEIGTLGKLPVHTCLKIAFSTTFLYFGHAGPDRTSFVYHNSLLIKLQYLVRSKFLTGNTIFFLLNL